MENAYSLAMKKRKALKSLKIFDIDDKRYYTAEELDCITYFHCNNAFYKRYQDVSIRPDIYDIRQSFLLKMRTEFLNSLNRRKDD